MQSADETYLPYYLRAIEQQQQKGPLCGLKLVVGPTGLGKTYAIPLVIKELQERGFEHGSIYTTHRHMLLEEMRQKLASENIAAVYLRSDNDQVQEFLRDVDLPVLLNEMEQSGVLQAMGETTDNLLQMAASIQKFGDLINDNQIPDVVQMVRHEQSKKSTRFIKIFQTGLTGIKQKERERWLYDPRLWKLFPYIAFCYQQPRPVLLVTVSKLLHGFFNGQRHQTIASLRKNIIFLDEFEFQEREILSFLCQQAGIRDNFEFVRLFYNEMVQLREEGRLIPDVESSEARQNARKHITSILSSIEEESIQPYQFPQITRFLLDPEDFTKDTITIFQSRHIIQTTPFYIVKENQAWRIVKNSGDNCLPSLRLLHFVSRTTDTILNFFADLRARELVSEWQEWIDQCYNRRNDSIQGAYHNIIAEYGQIKRPVLYARRESPPAVSDSIYAKGFNVYRLKTGTYQHTVPDEAQVNQLSLHVTPEYIFWQLCQDNLVFGISATGDIPRYVQAFDLPWLQQTCDFLTIDAEDKQLIARLTERKKQQRTYNVALEMAKTLPGNHRLQRMLAGLTIENFFETDQQEQETVTQKTRHTVLNRFLETLRWVTSSSRNKAHLVFVNSFRYIAKLLEKKCQMHERDEDDMTAYLKVARGRSNRAQEYHVFFEERPCTVILLDAAKAREQQIRPFAYYPQDGPLLLVTQYETAANGVNLEWQDVTDATATPGDFQSIHLLESKHFYFDAPTDQPEDNQAVNKSFYWRLWKLSEGRQISQQTLKTHLESAGSGKFNAIAYKQTMDYLLNQIALFHQAFGRIDRKHTGSHTVEVRLADTSSAGQAEDSVFTLLARYLQEGGAIGQQREERAIYTSPLILQIYQHIEQASSWQRASNQVYREDITGKQQRSQQCVNDLLKLIEQMREGDFDEDSARKIKRLWIAVREAVLRQDYHFSEKYQNITINFQQDCVHSTAYLQPGDTILVDNRKNPTTILEQVAPDTVTLSLNWPYHQIADNPLIRRYFETRAYPVAYQRTITNDIFTPFILQALLAGAVGEIALQAVLDHYHIPIERSIDHPTLLFEMYDLKIEGKPLYLDAKNFGQTTIDRINATPSDPEFQPELNSAELLQKAQEKWRRIVEVTGDPKTRFIMVNLQIAGERNSEYWDAQLNRVNTFRESAITIIQGLLDTQKPAHISMEFQRWIEDIKEV